ncbi:MAG: hypothetical protein AB1491_00100 [Thermodesulfobacteriota bacterium]
MAKPFRIYGFKGMNNLPATPAILLDDRRFLTPRVILNADLAGDGVLRPRGGYRKLTPGVGCHSLWDGGVTLYVARGADGGPALFRLLGNTPVEVAPVGGPDQAPMVYLEANSLVYLSNGYWTGVYDPAANTVRSWGLPLPPRPRVNLVPGDLPPGRYSLCYTHYEGTRLGGNGPVTTLEFHGDSMGIELVEQPAGTLCWITQADGADFFLAPVESGAINQPYYAQPLPTLDVIPPPAFTDMFAAAGRILGIAGKKLYFSREFRLEQFREASTFPFTEDLVLLAPINEGIFVNSLKTTWLLKGFDPHKMGLDEVGGGAIPGTLTYALVEGPGYEISRKLSQVPSPVWASPTGMVVGTQNGHLVHLTENRLRLWPMSRGAACHFLRQGWPLTLFTLYGTPKSTPDPELQAVFSRGRIFVPAPLRHTSRGGVIISGEGVLS